MTGSWRGAYWAFAGILAAYCLACFLFIQYPEGVAESLAQQKEAIKAGLIPKPEFELKRVFARRNFVLLTMANILPIICSGLFQTYMPTYLTLENGMEAARAAIITGTGVFAGMAGSVIGGLLVGKSDRRKTYLILGNILFVAAGLGAVLSKNPMFILVLFILYNVGFYLRMPAMSQYLVEEVVPYDPSIIAPAAAVTSGIPMLLGLVGSAIAAPMTVSAGYGKTLVIFQVACLSAILFSLMLTECGPRASGKAE